jgi:hypothetical protein
MKILLGFLIVFICSDLFSKVDAQVIPFVNCTINQAGGNCLTTWGWRNDYSSQVVLSLVRNKFSPAPIYRGQPTVFPGSTIVYKAFNTTRPCSSGSLTWSLTDPFTNIIYSATTTNTPGNTCVTQPVTVDCTNNTIVAERLLLCQSMCGSQCAYCGQVFSYCDQMGLLIANFTLDNCIITNLGFTPVSSGCQYETVVDNCCQNVGPPISPPIEPPVTPPIEPPVEPPTPVPPTPDTTAVCGFSSFGLGYECMSNVINGLTCSQRIVTCGSIVAANANSTESGSCLINSMSASDNTVDCDYVANSYSCCGVGYLGFNCTSQSDCALNYVCTGNPGTCIGIEDATCNSTQDCSYAYNCVSGICTNAAQDAFQQPLVQDCTSAPTLTCNSTYSIALSESNVLLSSLGCSSPTTNYPIGSPIAFFYLPASTLDVNTFNVSMAVYLPDASFLDVRSLLPCNSTTACQASLTPEQPFLNTFIYQQLLTLNDPGTVRGYVIVANEAQLPPLNGIIVNVTVQCGYIEPAQCSEVVYQSCTSSSDCPLTAPYCNTTLSTCQTLVGGACNVSSDCAEFYSITCDVNSCSCVGGNSPNPCTSTSYISSLNSCIFASGTPPNCSSAIQNCYNPYFGSPSIGGIQQLDDFESLVTCSLGAADVQTSCWNGACLQSYCDTQSDTCASIELDTCTQDSDCTSINYPFCDQFNGVCTGAGASPCSIGNDCGTRQCDNCICTTNDNACSTLNARNLLTARINQCITTETGTCAERIANCQTQSYTGSPAMNNVTLIGNINQCIAVASLPGCNVANCVTSGCAGPTLQCQLSDNKCACGQCCVGSQCLICPTSCTSSANCPMDKPICATENNRCTSNTVCGVPVPVDPPKSVQPLPTVVEYSLLEWLYSLF